MTAAVPAVRTRSWRKRWVNYAVLPLSFAGLIATWYVVIWAFSLPNFVVPAPHEVLEALWSGLARPYSDRTGLLWHAAFTATEAVLGFSLGAISGILLAILITEVQSLERVISPYVMAFQSLPRIALAPLFIIWFGFGMTSKVAIIVALVFFPLVINTTEGLKGVDPDQVSLMRILRARRWTILRKIKLPFALPHIFSGLKLGVTMSIVGAIVGEFVGGRRGLGVLLLQRQAVADVAGVFSIFIILSLLGAIGYGLVAFAERRFLFWARRLSTQPG